MARMVCDTNDGQHGRCHWGRKCCPSVLDMAQHKRKRRMLKRRERQQWKREATEG